MNLKKLQLKHALYILLLGIIILLVILLAKIPRRPSPTVIQTNPKNNQQYVSDTSSITIVLQKSLADEEKAQIGISSTPTIDLTTSWPSHRQLLAVPTTPFSADTSYTIAVTYKDALIHTFSFKTKFYSTEELRKQVWQQAEDDLIFGKAFAEFIQKYPWYRQLPIDNENYTIVYDFEKKAFRIRLKIQTKTPEEKDAIVKQALADLKEIGIDTKVANYDVLETKPN